MQNDSELKVRTGLLVVISAPSGGGKTTVCNNLMKEGDDPRPVRAVTCTTRSPRAGEREGVDYHFLSESEFEQRVAVGDFLEHAEVHGHRYGTLKMEVLGRLRAGRDVLLNIDVQGAATVRAEARRDPELGAALVTVFLTPPSAEALEERLRGRRTESDDALRLRLTAARGEVARWAEFDYLLVSGTMAEDVQRLGMILGAERLRAARSAAPWL